MKRSIAILFLFLAQYSLAQTPPPSPTDPHAVSGKVTNERGEPLSGVSISTRLGKGTVTNAQGLFSFRQLLPTDILQVSFVGYTSQRLPVGNNTSLVVTMQPTESYLDQVIVQPYGITNRRNGTGNISKVTAAEIQKQPVINVVQILQGRAPGTTVTNANGFSSASVKIEIRGQQGIDPTIVREPLYIIDGVPLTTLNLVTRESRVSGSALAGGSIQSGLSSPAGGQSPFFNVNPADIESIEVLKDADATAIYGSRGSNGVILITTKKGKMGKTTIDLNVYTGFSKVTRFYPLLNTPQYVALRKEALKNDRLPIDQFTAPDLVYWDTSRYTNWLRYAFGGTGRLINAQLSLSGGTEQTNIRIGAGYTYQRDITAVSGGNKRGSLSLAVQHKTPRQKFIVDLTVQYSLTSSDLIYPGGSALLPPNAPAVYDSTGKLNFAGWAPLSTSFAFGSLLQPYKATTNLLNSNLVITYNIAKGWKVKVNVGYNNSVNKQTHTIPIASLNPMFNPKGSLTIGRTFFHNLISEPQLEYNAFLAAGKLSVLVGASYQSNQTNGLLTAGTNYSNDLLLGSINAAPNKVVVENNAQYKYNGGFLRLSYNWLNKYIINLNGRRDGSSRFGPGRRFGDFGSVGTAWIFTEEPFMKKKPFISFGKLRASYGVTGSDQIGDYAYLPLWEFGARGLYSGQVPLFPIRFADSLLQWERNRKLEIAFQVGFWQDRINIEVSYYRNRCNNQLVRLPVATQSGFGLVITNTPANVQNTGVEVVAAVTALRKTNWNLNSRINVSVNRNKLLSYPNFDQSPYKGRFVVGKPLNIQKYLHYTGVDPSNGQYLLEDVNKDGKISLDFTGNTPDDRVPIVMSPQFEVGFSTELTYKQWSLSVLFYGRKQRGFNALLGSEQPGSRSNQPHDVMDYWKKPGDNTTYGRPLNYPSTSSNNYAFYSDARISDASFIRLQNLSLAWSLPEKTLQKLHLNNLQFFLQGENLLLITRYKGNDPEVQELGTLPRPAVLTAGISAKF